MPTIWRIVPLHRAETAFDGEGARLFGGRWNSRGTRMVYCSESRALAILETLVHLTPANIHRRLSLLGVEIDPELIEVLPEKKLPPDWRAPMASAANKKVGDDWVRSGRSAVLQISSAIIPEENNFLLNPAHPALTDVRILRKTDFSFDGRLRAKL
jgi:RES domain-containing protein